MPRATRTGMRWAAPDHASLLEEAVRVAVADGFTKVASLLDDSHLNSLGRGAVDADYPGSGGYVLHLYHFHHPWTHRGFACSPISAAGVSARLVAGAAGLWRKGERRRAVYDLGRASHLLADCWIPYHAAGAAGCGHDRYEAWLNDGARWREFLPERGGRYEWLKTYRPRGGGPSHFLDSASPWAWVDLAAHESFPWFEDFLNGCSGLTQEELEAMFPAAAAALVPAAVRHLAGYLNRFFVLAGEAGAASRRSGGGGPAGQPPSPAGRPRPPWPQ